MSPIPRPGFCGHPGVAYRGGGLLPRGGPLPVLGLHPQGIPGGRGGPVLLAAAKATVSGGGSASFVFLLKCLFFWVYSNCVPIRCFDFSKI